MFFFSPGKEESFKATKDDGAADDERLSFDLALSLPLFFREEKREKNQILSNSTNYLTENIQIFNIFFTIKTKQTK